MSGEDLSSLHFHINLFIMKTSLYVLILIFPFILLAQNKRDHSWQFEDYEMVFDSTGMKTYPRWSELGRMDRAVCSLSDERGNLITYTNGCRIGNKNHNIMPDGDSINFHQLFYDFWLNCEQGYPGRQNILMLPDPMNQDNVFMVHDLVNLSIDSMLGVVEFVHNKLSYSYIETSRDSGLGDVTEKNKTILNSRTTVSHLTAINHKNKKDWWILKPAYQGEKYYRILLDENGFSKIDSQYIGPKLEIETEIINPNGVGSSKFSPNGKKLAYFSLVDGLHVYDFDRATGWLSNHKSLDWAPIDSHNILGDIEFSPNSNYLYICNEQSVFQIDLSQEDLSVSLTRIATYDENKSGGLFTFMALGPDCKIYIRQQGAFQFDFSSINNPNEMGLACDFRQGNVIMPYPPNLGDFPHFPRFRVDEDKPCCTTSRTPIEDAPSIADVFCGEWYKTVEDFGVRRCDNSAFFTEMKLYRKGDIELLYFDRFLNGVGRGAFFDLNGYTVGRSETRDGVFTVYPDSIQDYQLVRVLGDCQTGFPTCEGIAFDCPDLVADIGDSCNDNNPDTTGDVITSDCTCEGALIFDCPDLMLNIGDDCDDGDAATSNDTIDMDCNCVGIQLYDCPSLMVDIGDSCDDGNPDTIDDIVSSNCICEGQITFDCPQTMQNIGDPCDDNEPNTGNDNVNSDCLCTGDYIFPESSCPDDINEMFCEQWLLDSLAVLQPWCDNGQGWVIVELLENDTLQYIHIRLCYASDGCDGTVYTCTGEVIGTSFVDFGGITYNPTELVEFQNTIVADCNNSGYPLCPAQDNDGDGFTTSQDCNDNDPNIFPGSTELCNDVDDNCDGQIDEGFTILRYYLDNDGDGYGVPNPSVLSCAQPAGYSLTFDDCDDNDPSVNPGTVEGPYNGKDDDCDPTTPDDDLDGDGFLLVDDCNDLDSLINPTAAELCDDIDNNCNNEIDEGLQLITGYLDMDNDGFGSGMDSIVDCTLLVGYVTNSDDCIDTNPNINPNTAEEPYNGLDDDCNPETADDDLDGDGYLLADDCNDLDSLINPSAMEIPNNGIDEDCDGADLTNSTLETDNDKIKVYPIPVNNTLYIEVSNTTEFELTLFDLEGRLILSKRNRKTIDTSDLSIGTYILRIQNRREQLSYVVKVVVLRE